MPISTIENFGIISRTKSYNDRPSVVSPSWLSSSIVYEINPRAFSSEATFAAITSHLPDLKEFGIDIVWLMPIHTIGTKKRKGPLGSPYAVRDHFRVHPNLGKKEDFAAFVHEAHRLGLRVVLDLVSNHGAQDHAELQNHPEWFCTDETGQFTRLVPGWSDVIDFNYDNPQMVQYMKDVMIYWTQEMQIDGFRCDVAGLVPESFWADVRNDLAAINPDIIMIAEWEDPELHLRSFDVTYDWSLYHTLTHIYNGESDAQSAVEHLCTSQQQYPPNALRFRFLENHDHARAVYKFGIQSFRPFAALIFTAPGVPLINNGQEVGDTKYISLFDQSPINWKIRGASHVRAFYKSLIQLRKQHPMFTCGTLGQIQHDNYAQIAAFFRQSSNQFAGVILNLSDRQAATQLSIPHHATKWTSYNITSMQTIKLDKKPSAVTLDPYDGIVLIAE